MREGLGTSVKMTENNEVVVIVRVLLSFLHFLSVGSVILHDECEIFIHQPPKMFNKIHFMLKCKIAATMDKKCRNESKTVQRVKIDVIHSIFHLSSEPATATTGQAIGPDKSGQFRTCQGQFALRKVQPLVFSVLLEHITSVANVLFLTK